MPFLQLLIWLADAPDSVIGIMRNEITDMHMRMAQLLNTSFQSAAAFDKSVRDQRKRGPEFIDYSKPNIIKKPKANESVDGNICR